MIYICDDFFDNSYAIRKAALESNYSSASDHSWPGYRCWDVPDYVTNFIRFKARKILNDERVDFDNERTQIVGLPNSSFQYIPKEYGDGMFHADPHQYICIVYLSLESPVCSGTEVSDISMRNNSLPGNISTQKATKLLREHYGDISNLIKRYRYGKLKKELNSYFKNSCVVANKFNRCVIFPANNFHRAQNFFGTSVGNGRLTSVSFLNK